MRLQIVLYHFWVHLDCALVDSSLISLSNAQSIKFLQVRKLLEYDWPVTSFCGCWVAFESELFKSRTVLHNMIKLAQIFDPVVPQVKIDKFLLIRQILYLTDKVVIEVQLSQFFVFLKTFDLLNLIE